MIKTGKWKRTTALAACSALLMATAVGGLATLPAGAASYENEYGLNVSHAFQEFDGWGLSLSWWATEIGDWTRMGSSGMSKREEIMEAIYGKSGLDLNIARYNVGGGDDPEHTHMTGDRNTPGWRGADKITAEDQKGDEQTYYAVDNDYVFTAEDGSTLSWEQVPDWKQLWVLDWIQKNRDDAVTEYYSNSPPYWMTKYGCSSGGAGGWDNLDPVNNEAFVEYFLDVYEYLVGQGFTFENLQPFNESGSNYWGTGGDQEGCYFGPQQKVDVLEILAAEMERRGIDAVYNVGDETSTGVANSQYRSMRALTGANGTAGADVVDGASRLTYHIYSYDVSGAQQMYRNAKSHGQEVYMSEICFTTGSEYDPEAMGTGFAYTQSIIDTVKFGGVDGYVFWQGMEDMVGQIKSGTNYGLIQGVYYTQEEAEAQGTDLAAMGLTYQDFVLSKAYYMSGQYTKYIRPGYTIIDVSDDNTVAAISPDGKTVVVVKQNNSDHADSFKLDLTGFRAESAERVLTDPKHSWSASAISTDGSSIIDAAPASSVTTYIIHGERTGGEGDFLDDSFAAQKNSLTAIQEAFEAGGETEQAYTTLNLSQYDCSKEHYLGSTYTQASNRDCFAFRFKGIGFGLPFIQKSDSGQIRIWVDTDPSEEPTATVDLRKSSKTVKQIVYSTKELGEGWHTVYVMTEGSSNQYVNFDGAFLYRTLDQGAAERSIAVTEASGVGSTLRFAYTAEGYEGFTFYPEYRYENETEWHRSETALDAENGTLTGLTDRNVLLRIAAVKEGTEEFSPVQKVVLREAEAGVLYFADCGSAEELATGAVLGEYQSATDQPYGADIVSGKKWGYKGDIKQAYYTGDGAMSSVWSLDGGISSAAIEYAFEIPAAGAYHVSLGFFNPWSTRRVKITVTGNDPVSEFTLEQGKYSVSHFTVTTTQADEEITVKVEKAQGESESAFLSLVAVTEEGVKLPISADVASNYNTQFETTVKELTVGGDLYGDLRSTHFNVWFTDGTKTEYTCDSEGVICTVASGLMAAGGNVNVTLTLEGCESFEVYAKYVWKQGGEQLYYNIDVGFTDTGATPPDDAEQLGSLQSSTRDRAYAEDPGKNTSWGYVGQTKGCNWENNGSNEWSIREGQDQNYNGVQAKQLVYKMTGFQPNEVLRLMTGGHCSGGWGARSYDVICNGTTVGTISLPDSDARVYEEFKENVTADGQGVLEIVFKAATGDCPQVGYIKVWSTGEALPAERAITADKTTVSRADSFQLRNLNPASTVYVLDEDSTVLDSFKPEGETMDVAVSDYLPEGKYELHFVQATEGETAVSQDLVISIPDVDYTVSAEFVEEGDAALITFLPHTASGVTSLTLRTPDGVSVNVAEGFFYRAYHNGEYTLTLVSGGVTVTKTITVDRVDGVDFGETFSAEGWTKNSVTITLAPVCKSGIKSLTVNGAPAELDGEGKYTITAAQNGDYLLHAVTNAGFEYDKTISVSNIDKEAPVLGLGADFSVADGIGIAFEAESVSGGKLYAEFNGVKSEITEEGFTVLNEAGKYEFYFTNGVGDSTAKKTYYVTYGTSDAHLATVTVAADGSVTVSDGTAKLYRAGNGTALSALKADKAGKYYLEIVKDGETEIIVFTVAAESIPVTDAMTPASGTSKKGGTSPVMIAGIVIGVVAVVAAAAVCTFILKGRKKS